jgi:O-acetyl-ADP-ribose deacetylase (regulator of RNase III)
MLHMVVHAHTAESCPFRSEENRTAMGEALYRLMSLAKEHGAEMRGSWVNTGAHVVFSVVEAPSAHVVNTLIEASGLAARGTTTVYAVTELAAQMSSMGMGSD